MEDQEGSGSILQIVVAVLIAVAVVLGALATWRSSVADDGAGDEDYAGVRALVYASQTRSRNFVNAYQSYGNYVTYWRNSRSAGLLQEDLTAAPEDRQEVLTQQMKIANDLADANNDMFEVRYLNRDGSYSVKRQLAEMWSSAARRTDFDFETRFKEADKLRSKSLKDLLAVMVLAIAPILYSLTESVAAQKAKYALVASGSVFFAAGAVLLILIEMGIF